MYTHVRARYNIFLSFLGNKEVEAQEPKLCPAPEVSTKLATCPTTEQRAKQIHVVELD